MRLGLDNFETPILKLLAALSNRHRENLFEKHRTPNIYANLANVGMEKGHTFLQQNFVGEFLACKKCRCVSAVGKTTRKTPAFISNLISTAFEMRGRSEALRAEFAAFGEVHGPDR
jgi:hypothetical protein